MNRNELKKFIAERKNSVYANEIYNNLATADYKIYNPYYKKNNFSSFAYFQSQREVNAVTLLKHSKLFAHYHENDLLCKMQEIAQRNGNIVVPVRLLHWRRRQALEKQYYAFQASKYHYLIMPESELNERERRKYIDYIRKMDWNHHLP